MLRIGEWAMKIKDARKITGFEKCDFEAYDENCERCGSKQTRFNSENYIRTSYEYDEGEYACNGCVKAQAVAMSNGDCYS